VLLALLVLVLGEERDGGIIIIGLLALMVGYGYALVVVLIARWVRGLAARPAGE
jgi:hypothetical protein